MYAAFLVLLFLLSAFSITHASSLVDVVDTFSNATLIRHGKHVYLLRDGIKFTFPDRYTFNSYGQIWRFARNVNKEMINSYSNGGAVPSLRDHHSNEAILSFGETPSLQISKLFDALNLNYVYWKHYIVLCWRITEQKYRIVAMHKGSSLEEDIKRMSSQSVQNYYYNEFTSDIDGEDPRLFVTHNVGGENQPLLWISFCKRYSKTIPEIQMSLSLLSLYEVDGSNGDKTGVSILKTWDIDYEYEEPRKDQKNWSPFEHVKKDQPLSSSELLFVTYPNPLRVVRLFEDANTYKECQALSAANNKTSTKESTKIQVITVSVDNDMKQRKVAWPTSLGEMRGGTPAIKVPHPTDASQSLYLSFFHSSNDVNEPVSMTIKYMDVLKTYTMGAFLFSITEPFQLLYVSDKPLIHKSLYTGNWPNQPWAFNHMDYIVFPTNVHMKDDVFYLQFGKQDKETWIASLTYTELKKSLITVKN
jgi:hypothetical protein